MCFVTGIHNMLEGKTELRLNPKEQFIQIAQDRVEVEVQEQRRKESWVIAYFGTVLSQ